MMKTLTVMTPTYNRAELLKNAYDSLVSQTDNDFVWMIVDDGSTDGTKRVVESFIAEGRVEIEYIYKENGGKHTAINTALDNVKTPLIALCLDSDDTFVPDAVERIVGVYRDSNEAYDGYVFLRDGDGMNSDPTLSVSSWQDAVVSGRFSCETVIVLKSSYAVCHRFHVFEGERFCTEGLVWLGMTEPFRWEHRSLCTGENYLPDGYSKNIALLFAENPKCFTKYNDLRLSLWNGFAKKYKYAAYYDGFAKLSGKKNYVRRSSRPFWAALAYPAGILFYLYLKTKKR